jgi:hypothetical protein
MSNFPSGDSHHSASQTHLSPLRASQSSAPPPFVHAAPVVAIAQAGKGCLTMLARHHLPLCGIVVGHCHPQCIICAADIVAIMQQGEERATWQGTTIHAVAAFHRRALLDTPLQLSWSHVTARNAQRCQGTFVRTATTLVVAPIVAWLPLLLPTEKGKKWPPMPRLHHPLCHPLSALPPLSLSREQARDGRQWRQGTIFCLPLLSLCTIIHAAVQAVEWSSCQAIKPR